MFKSNRRVKKNYNNFPGWNTVAVWKWLANDDKCGICRAPFDGCCSDCKVPGDDCPLGSRINSLINYYCN